MFLLDTQAWLLYASGSPRLGSVARQIIEERAYQTWVSVICVWEFAIKTGAGKLVIRQPLDEMADAAQRIDGFSFLAITVRDAITAGSLPPHHRDPFDRMLVAQALGRSLTVLSGDAALDRYGVSRVW